MTCIVPGRCWHVLDRFRVYQICCQNAITPFPFLKRGKERGGNESEKEDGQYFCTLISNNKKVDNAFNLFFS